jgi:hypothetical protein
MTEKSGSSVLTLTLIAGLFLQVVLGYADSCAKPYQVATRFAEAYFKLDPTMAQNMVNNGVTEDEVDLVDAYLYDRHEEARQRGLAIGMLKSRLSHVHTATLEQTDDTAKIQLTAMRRTAINPVFYIVATAFRLGDTQEVEAVIELKKEGNAWKVEGRPFDMARL